MAEIEVQVISTSGMRAFYSTFSVKDPAVQELMRSKLVSYCLHTRPLI